MVESGTATLDWSCKAGEVDTNLEGYELNINKAKIKASVTSKVDSSKVSLSGNGSAVYGVNVKENLFKMMGIDSIPFVSANGLFDASGKFKMAGSILNDEPDTFSASANAYAGVSYVVAFNTDKYSGLAKLDAEASAKIKLSQDELEKYETLFDGDFNPNVIDDLIDLNLSISVYDINGNKAFDYKKFTSFSEVYEFIKQFDDEE